MNVMEFASKYLQPYRFRGEEISPKHCPFCGRNTKDTYTFFINPTKETYVCHRGSCAAQGHFTQLLKHFGEEVKRVNDCSMDFKKTQKHYKKPKVDLKPLTNEAEQYLQKRLIGKETLTVYKVSTDDKGNILFPYYDEAGTLTFIKYRPVGNTKDLTKKSWRESETKPILWGMNLCSYDLPLVITEGEPDCLALYEAGVRNVVSVPSGSKDFEWVDNCWNWLEGFKKIVLFGDNDEPGKEMVEVLSKKLGEYRTYISSAEPCKDANELLYKMAKADGIEKAKKELMERVSKAKPTEFKGIISMSQVKRVDYSNLVKVKSSVQALNHYLDGYFMGQTSIWTGINSSGKSTFLGQELIYTVEQGFNVCAYSGELPAFLFKNWIDLQVAGKKGITQVYSQSKQSDVTVVKKEIMPKIDRWYDNRFFLFDTSSGVSSNEELFRVFEYAAKRYNCKVFLIDNIMTVDYEKMDRDFYRAQSKFVGEVIAFSKRLDVHVHLVAHPRKALGKLTKMDVMGSGDITNRADNVLSIHRVAESERTYEKKGETFETQYHEMDNLIQVFKNRYSGVQDIEIGLQYDKETKRMWKEGEEQITVNWDVSEWIQQSMQDITEFQLPF